MNIEAFYKCLIFSGLAVFLTQSLEAQVRLRVRVDSGNSGTTCTDNIFGGAPDPQWRVRIAGQGWTTYPQAGICFTNPPNTQYDETFDCPAQYPTTIQVCFRAFEDDGGVCIVGESCLQELCQNFPVPAAGGSASYSITIPNCCGNTSWGTVNFTIWATGGFTLPGAAYDQICNAVNLGTLNSGAQLGNPNLSNYGNFCATNTGDPNPPGWNNEQGVWFQFTTGPNPGAVITVDARNDPQGFGDQIDLQLALYRSNNNTCTGALTHIQSEHTIPLYSEEMSVECLQPNTTYFLLVDGANNGIFGGQEGYFGLAVRDNGIAQAGDQICQAQHLGTVPAGGSVGTPALSQSNVCATNTGDPVPPNWGPDKSVWYSFNAPPSGNAIVEANSDAIWPFGNSIDIQLAMYGTNNNLCTGTLQYIDSEYDFGLFDEDMNVRCLTPGQTYWIMLDGSALDVAGVFDIRVRDGGIPPAPNDDICNAIPLGQPAPNGTVGLNNQNNYCADNLFEPIPSNWGNDQGVWYTFVAPPSGKVEVRLTSQSIFQDPIDLQVAVYDASNMTCTGTLTELASEHEGFGLWFDEDMEVECLIPGRTYFILVDGEGSIFNPGLQEGVFNIQVYGDPRDPAGPNNLICDAIALGDPTGGSVGTVQTNPAHQSQNNFCADAVGEPQPNNFTADQTVWYSFVAPSTGAVNINAVTDNILFGEDPINLQIAVWASSNNACNGVLTEEFSGDDLLYSLNANVWCLIPGNTYFVQVDGTPPALLGGHEGYFDITITEIPPIPVAPNDLICDAIDLGNPFAASVTLTAQHNLCADDVGDPQPSAFGTDHTVWYMFHTPATGGPFAVDINVTSSLPWPFGNQNAIDPQVAVYGSGNNTCTGSLFEVESFYTFPPFSENVRVQCLEEGRTYFVMVDGSWLDDQGFFDISISPAPAVPIPTNDNICDHTDLGTVPVGGSINNNVNYFNFCATTEPGEPSPFGIDQTVWFSFIAPNHPGPNATSEVTVRVRNDPNNVGNGIDLQLAVYESSNNTCSGSLSLLEDGSSDPLFSTNAEVNLTCLYPGRRYWVQVDGSFFNVEGYFTIEIRDDGAGIRPTNDNLCTPVALGQVPNGGNINNGVNYYNFCSGTQPGEPNPSAFGIEQTVWFTFQAPTSGNVTITALSDPNNLGDNIDLQLAVYYSSTDSCNGAFIEVDSRYNPFGFNESLSLDCLVPGETYFVQVDGAGGGLLGGEEGYFTIRIQDDGGTTNFPYNNNICQAYNFGTPTGTQQTLNNQTNVCANVEFGEPGVGGYATHTVWYQFTAPASGRVRIRVQSSNIFLGMDPQVFLFASSNNACTGAFTQVESSNWPTALITEEIEATCLIPGNTYFIQVDGSGLVIEGTFSISIVDMFPNYGTGLPGDPEPNNNNCANATSLTVQGSSCFNGSGNFLVDNYGFPTITYNPPFAQNCNDNCGDTWYSFTMPATGIALVEGNDDGIGGGVFGDYSTLTVVAYTGTCNNLTPIACGAGGFFNDVSFEIAATPGSTVWLQVFNDEGNDDNEDFEICVSEGCGADHCLNALAYPIQPNTLYCFNTAAATGENVSGGQPGYVECGEGDNPEHSIYYYFVSDCNGSAVTINIVNAYANGNCLFGTVPSEGFGFSFFQDNTPCDGQPQALVDCQNFNSCQPQPINWSFTYNNLLPSTAYIVQIDGGFNFLGGDNAGYIMIQTTTNPVVYPTSTPVGCGSSNDGTATAVVAGGVPPFSFLWSNGSTDSIATGLAAGLYTVTVTSSNGCTATGSVNVGNTGGSMNVLISSFANASCTGLCDGTATAAGSGGAIGGYSYLWSDGQTTAAAVGLCPGTYSVTVSDFLGCSGSTSVTISEPTPLLASLQSATQVSCGGFCDAQATVTASGGTVAFGYNYLWSNGTTFATATGLCAGNHSVTVYDDRACSAIVPVTIGVPPGITGSLVAQTDVDCNGAATGSVTVSAVQGALPYTFAIDGGVFGASPTFSALTAGSYTVTVQDANGCQDTVGVVIQEPTALTATLLSAADPVCAATTDGQIQVQADAGSGTAPYQYSIDGINFQASGTFSGLAPGNYTITVQDANGCQTALNATLTAPPLLTTSIDAVTDLTCFGSGDGAVQASSAGGVGAHSYSWNGGLSGASLSGLAAGTYCLTVSDAGGCTATACATVTQPSQIVPAIVINTNFNNFNISCNGSNDGAAAGSASGGTAPYGFVWSNGQTGVSATGLFAGSVSVTVTDDMGCTATESAVLTQAPALTTVVNLNQNVSCFGGSNGSATALPSGGVAPYSYAWSNGTPTATAANLTAGTHTVTVSDANGCTATAGITITEPTLLQAAAGSLPALCNGTSTGTVFALGSGGIVPYTFFWSNTQTAATVNGVPAGAYSVTVTDLNGCTATASTTVVQPSPILVNVFMISNYNGAQISCPEAADGIGQVMSVGGTGAHSYLWTNGETTTVITGLQASNYYVTVTDQNGCQAFDTLSVMPPPLINASTSILSNYNGFNVACANGANGSASVSANGGTGALSYLWSNGQTATTATTLEAGEYWVTITDINGCFLVTGGILTAPPALTVNINNVQDVTCNGLSNGSATASAAGGLPPYTYLWSNGITTAVNNSLSAGMRHVTVTDVNGCTAVGSVIINEPAPLLLMSTSSSPATCNGASNGTASVTVAGGTTPYQYLWSNGGNTAVLTGLAAGNYTVTVRDANNCTVTALVAVLQPLPITVNAVVTSNYNGQALSCNGSSNGAASVSAWGGVGGFGFVWNTGAVTASIGGLSAGTYTVTATDANGCTAVGSVQLVPPAPVAGNIAITSNYNGQALSCNGASNASVLVTPSGGVPPYFYLWSNGQTTAAAAGLPAGIHTVTITDFNGCTATSSVTITPPPALTLNMSLNQAVSCYGGSDGIVQGQVGGGTPAYSYLWSSGQSSATVSGLPAGVYQLTVVDANGCTLSGGINVTEPMPLVPTAFVQQMPGCAGGSNGTAGVSMTGGTAPYSYQWSNGQTSATATGLAAGVHTVTVTDAKGCIYIKTFVFFDPAPLGLQFINVQGVTCNNGNDGEATAQVTGGTMPYAYAWEGGFYTNPVATLAYGYNTLTVTDANGCVLIDSVFIDNPNPLIVAGGQQDVDCQGNANGSASVTVLGGVAPYSYLWSNGAADTAIHHLAPGVYWCTVTDARGCTAVIPFLIREPANPLLLELVKLEHLKCAGDANGAISVRGTGGTETYTFTWSNGTVHSGHTSSVPSNLTGLPGGTYAVTLTDANGCWDSLEVTVLEPAPVVASAVGGRTRCFNSTDGWLSIQGSGGTLPYRYYLENFAPTLDSMRTGLAAGTYTVGVVDANGCYDETTVTITRPDSTLLSVPPADTINLGETVEIWVFMPINVPQNAHIQWTPPTGLACDTCNRTLAQPPVTTYYTVTVVGDDNCPVSAGVWIYVNDVRDVFIPNAFTPTGDGINDVFMVYAGPQVLRVSKMLVFDRWGELLFEAANVPPNFPGYGWDGTYKGKPMMTGVYVYLIEIEFIDGVKRTFKGDLTLMR